jgi:superfamily II DNA/RNA helicase
MSVRFRDLGAPEDVAGVLEARGIAEAFPIQAAAIPDILAGRDVCGRAPTGSGKTLAFGVPIAARVGRARSLRPRALVLAPTRELAAQICRELEPLLAVRRRTILAVYGGVGYAGQRRPLQAGVDVLVACPGRLEDLLQQGAVRLDEVEHVVVDEADRMADMGFLPAVRRLISLTPRERQVVLFSATLEGDVAKLVREFQRDPVRHDVAPRPSDAGKARHAFWTVEQDGRPALAHELVASAGPTIVFCRTRHRADRVARDLGRRGTAAAAIHGGRSQSQRDRALAAFAGGSIRALVATDVAARGIHVDDVACVLHYDPPADATTYVHRSGRTARAGSRGMVVSFVSRDDVAASRRLSRALGLDGSPQAPSLGDVPRREAERAGEAQRSAASARSQRASTSARSGPGGTAYAALRRRPRAHTRSERRTTSGRPKASSGVSSMFIMRTKAR